MSNPSLAQLTDAALAAPPRCGSTRVILVDGPAGSGKTTLAARLGDRLGAQVLHADDMYEGWTGLATLSDTLVHGVLEPLARAEAGGFERWDWATSARAERIDVPPTDALVIEGVGVAQAAARPFASLTVYVDAPWELRLARGIARDGEALRPEWEAWQAAEEAFLVHERTREAADFLINGAAPFDDDAPTSSPR